MFLDDTVRLLKGTAPPFVSPAALCRKDPSDDEDELKVTEDSLDDTTDDNATLLTPPPRKTLRNLSPKDRSVMLHLLLSNLSSMIR